MNCSGWLKAQKHLHVDSALVLPLPGQAKPSLSHLAYMTCTLPLPITQSSKVALSSSSSKIFTLISYFPESLRCASRMKNTESLSLLRRIIRLGSRGWPSLAQVTCGFGFPYRKYVQKINSRSWFCFRSLATTLKNRQPTELDTKWSSMMDQGKPGLSKTP